MKAPWPSGLSVRKHTSPHSKSIIMHPFSARIQNIEKANYMSVERTIKIYEISFEGLY